MGHHPEYVRWILDGARARGLGHVAVAGPADLAEALPEAEVLPLPELGASLTGMSPRDARRRTADALRRAVETTGAASVLATALDPARVPLATGLRFSRPVRIAGILLRAALHAPPAPSLGGRGRQLANRLVLRGAAANPHLGRVFTLDPDAVASLRALGLDAVYLPDPVVPPEVTRSRSETLARYEIDADRRVALLFGSLEYRKGLFELLEALALLPPDVARGLAVALVGTTYDDIRPRLADAVRQLDGASAVQVVFHERFVPDDELNDLVAASDLVLAPYRRHVGSSGVVLRAAAGGRPVLGPETGQIGREVSRHRLGVTVDTSDPRAIADGLVRVLRGEGFDAVQAAAYAEAHSVERFCEVLFDDAPAR